MAVKKLNEFFRGDFFGMFTLHSLAGAGRLCLEYLQSLGTRKLTRVEIREEYPTKFCKLFEPMTGGLRFIQLFDTLFDTPKVSLITFSFLSISFLQAIVICQNLNSLAFLN